MIPSEQKFGIEWHPDEILCIKPFAQWHENDPIVFRHIELWPQFERPIVHSSISVVIVNIQSVRDIKYVLIIFRTVYTCTDLMFIIFCDRLCVVSINMYAFESIRTGLTSKAWSKIYASCQWITRTKYRTLQREPFNIICLSIDQPKILKILRLPHQYLRNMFDSG